jgi:hypothetical protein
VLSTVVFRLSTGQIHLDVDEVYLSAGVATHRIAFKVRTRASWLDPQVPEATAPTLLLGAVWTMEPSFRWITGIDPVVFALRGYPAAEECVISLTDDQLLALERMRGEGDVQLLLKLQLALLTSATGVHPVVENETTVRISRARWMELLDQAGTEVAVLIRVRTPLTGEPSAGDGPDGAASLSRAGARLRQARAELRDHRWEQSVATCRKVLEILKRLADIPSAKAVSAMPAQRTQLQRWAAIFHDVDSMTSAAHHHDSTTEAFTWTRTEAEAVLGCTAALLARYTA